MSGNFSTAHSSLPPQVSIYELSSGELTALQKRLADDADDLRKLLANQRGHAYGRRDCIAELKVILLRIGQDLLGSQKIGSAKGPLIGFVYLALLPVLGKATPNHEALRKFAEDHKADMLALEPLAPLKPLPHS